MINSNWEANLAEDIQAKINAGDASIIGDEWRYSAALVLDADDDSRFALRVNRDVATFAVEVKITGRRLVKIPRSGGACGFRVLITVPGDGEPDTSFGGYVFE